MKNENKPKISVLMLTYNHEHFIQQAISSVLSQIANFEFEIVIGNDASSDSTRDVIEELQTEHPDKIRAFHAQENCGMGRNFAFLLSRCRGEYIALLEGDDFWCADNKLQTQADYLDTHPGCALSFHRVRVTNGKEQLVFFPEKQISSIRTEELICENLIPTCSVLFRRTALPELPDWLIKMPLLDWPLFLLITQSGSADFIPKTLGVYRLHPRGVWSQCSPKHRYERCIKILEQLPYEFHFRYSQIIRKTLANFYELLAWQNEEEKLLEDAWLFRWRATAIDPSGGVKRWLGFCKLLVQLRRLNWCKLSSLRWGRICANYSFSSPFQSARCRARKKRFESVAPELNS